ncbi:MAG: 50S ribosomal protein L20 [Patescibacteria group bacterium]
MSRVKRGTIRARKRKALLTQAKGYRWGRKKIPRLANVAVIKAGVYQYRDRRTKKREFRKLWQVRLNAAVRAQELTYSKFIHLLKMKKVELDRKTLATLALEHPEVFARIIETVK